MPWNPGDAKRFKKDVQNPSRWASIANAILKETGDEAKAIRVANTKTRSKIQYGRK